MSLLIKYVAVFTFVVSLVNAQQQKTFDIKVEVKNAKNDEGKMFFALYDNEEDFLKKEIKGEIKEITNKTSIITFKNIPTGVYAVSVFHDENDNGEMDTNGLGIPTENFGCSNDAKGFMGPPNWKKAKFELSDKDKNIIINL
ncbi:MAG: DUF2141 domain-containing protein [Eudoraea sp.]